MISSITALIIIIVRIIALVFKFMGFSSLARVNEARYGAASVGLAAIVMAYILGALLVALITYSLIHGSKFTLRIIASCNVNYSHHYAGYYW